MTEQPTVSTHTSAPSRDDSLFTDVTIGFIGSGVMGEAIVAGLLKPPTGQPLVTPHQIIASDPVRKRGEQLERLHGIRTTTNNLEVTRAADILILAIKPQAFDKVLAELHGQAGRAQLLLSIIAGATIQRIAEGFANPNVVRTMPNTPARIGQGMTVWAAAPAVPEMQRAQAAAILRTLGQELFVDDERYLDMATAISGTGPAYVFLFMEAMIDAGVHLGFARPLAEQLVLQTLRGSVEYAAASKEHPAVLRNQVTSPGGTTAEALQQLEQGGFRTIISRAIWAAYDRSVALGAANKPVKPSRDS